MSNDIAKLILRLTLGVILVLYGFHKVRYGLGSVPAILNAHNLPAALAYVSYLAEVIAALLLIFGLYTRPAAAFVAIYLVAVITLAHANQLTAFNSMGGPLLSLQYLMLSQAIAIALLGAGRFSLHSPYN